MVGIYYYMLIAMIGMAESFMGMCVNDKPTTMDNEFLINKWKMFFKVLDANRDGKLSMEDVEGSENKFSDLEHLDAEQGRIVNKVFTKYWDECIFEGNKRQILQQDFVDSMKIDFNADTDAFVKEMERCFNLLFSAIDINKDNSISKKELQNAQTSFGHSKIAKDNDYFPTYNPKDGLVPLHVIVYSWVDFVTNIDESKGNVIQSGIDVDGFE